MSDKTILIGGQEFPNKTCLKDECKFWGDPHALSQGSWCYRCPLLNCVLDEDGFNLLNPSDYREDWAKEWKLFFEGKTDYPKLKLFGE